MDYQVSIYNGFNIGIERKKNSPMWVNFGEGYGIEFFSGAAINLLFVRINLGTFISEEEFTEELGDP